MNGLELTTLKRHQMYVVLNVQYELFLRRVGQFLPEA